MANLAKASFAELESKQYRFTAAVIQTLDNLNTALKRKDSDVQNVLELFHTQKISFNEYVTELNKEGYIYKNDLKNVDESLNPFLNDPDKDVRDISKNIIENIALLDKNIDETIKLTNDSMEVMKIDANLSGKLRADFQIAMENIANITNKVVHVLGLEVDDKGVSNAPQFVISNNERAQLLKMIDEKFGDAIENMSLVMSQENKKLEGIYKFDDVRIISAVTLLDMSLMYNKLRLQEKKDSHYYAVVKKEIDLGEGYGKNVMEQIIQTKSLEECQKQLEQMKGSQSNSVSSDCMQSNGRLFSIFNNEPIGRWYARRVTRNTVDGDTFETASVFDSRNIMKRLAISENVIEFIGDAYFKNVGKKISSQFTDKDYIVSPYGNVTLYYDSTKKNPS